MDETDILSRIHALVDEEHKLRETAEHTDEQRERVSRLEADAVRRAGESGVPLSFVSEYGDAIGTLTAIARTVDAHLIVVGRSAKIWHRLTGSLGHRLTCRKDAPVVVVVP
jgi:nucleotide-binding universal stress UspA family protein